MEQLKLRVNGMTCGACEQRIERVLAQLDGVVRSAADHRAARVKVVFDPARTSAQTVQARIKQAGYEVAASAAGGRLSPRRPPRTNRNWVRGAAPPAGDAGS